MNGEYLWNTGNSLAEMRLLAEGAVQLYENDAAPLNRLALDNGNQTAANAFNTIGTALYNLLVHIRNLQAAHIHLLFDMTKRLLCDIITLGYRNRG